MCVTTPERKIFDAEARNVHLHVFSLDVVTWTHVAEETEHETYSGGNNHFIPC